MQEWWRGQDSNLRSPSGRQIYSLVALTTHPPLRSLPAWPFVAARPGQQKLLEPPRGLEPLTGRLQVDCATVAPQGPETGFRLEKAPRSPGA